MKKYLWFILATVFIINVSVPAHAAGPETARVNLSFRYAPAKPDYFVDAYVEKLNGNQNRLTIIITELYSNGRENIITGVFLIDKNSAGTYDVGGYSVYVDTKGNIQIRKCEIVGGAP